MPIVPNFDMDKILPITYGIPAGDHLAELTHVEEMESKKSGLPMWVWFWDIKEGPSVGREIVSFTDNGTKVNNPFLVEALNNHLRMLGFQDGEYVDTDEYIGKKAVLMVVLHKKKVINAKDFRLYTGYYLTMLHT